MAELENKNVCFQEQQKDVPGSKKLHCGVVNTAVGTDIWYASADCFF